MSQPAVTPKAVEPNKAVKIAAGGVKKARNKGAKIITANDLFTGAAFYWHKERGWTDDIREALVVEGELALAELSFAAADEACSVGPYLMDVEPDGTPSGRAKLRETIREAGPTIHPQFGRQAQRA